MKAKRRKPPVPGMEEVPYLPGRWMDFSNPGKIAIREADGTLVADNVYITEEDAEKLKQKVLEMLLATRH